MLVKNWMNRKIITVNADDCMLDATKALKEHDIRMLPVLKDGKLVGVVTDRDLKRASASDATTLEAHELLYIIANIKIEEIMTRDPFTVFHDHTVEEAAEILLKNKISGAPVVGVAGEVVGIITQTDIFRVLISLTGVGKRGVQIAFRLEDRPGSIKEVADIIRGYGGRMASILTSYEQVPKGYRHVYIRFREIDRSHLTELVDECKKTAPLLYMVDHRDNTRKIFEDR